MPGATSPLPRWERVRVRVKQLDIPAYPSRLSRVPSRHSSEGGNPEERSFAPFVQRRGPKRPIQAKRQRGMPTATITPARKRHSRAPPRYSLAPPRHSRAPSRHSRAGGNLPSATSPLPRWERVRVRVNSPSFPAPLSTSPRDRRPRRERSTPGAGPVYPRSIFPLHFPLSDHVHEVD